MCSTLPPSSNFFLTLNPVWPGFGDCRAAMKVPTEARALSIAAFIFGSFSLTWITRSGDLLRLYPKRSRITTPAIQTSASLQRFISASPECGERGMRRPQRQVHAAHDLGG